MRAKLHKASLFLADYAGRTNSIAVVNPDAADRFCDAIERALDMIAQHPQIGALAGFQHAPTVRKWVVREFSNFILFYEVRPDGVTLIRLLHGAQHLPPLIPTQA